MAAVSCQGCPCHGCTASLASAAAPNLQHTGRVAGWCVQAVQAESAIPCSGKHAGRLQGRALEAARPLAHMAPRCPPPLPRMSLT